MKKKAINLLISNILTSFFLISLATYLCFAVGKFLEMSDKGESFEKMQSFGFWSGMLSVVGFAILLASVIVGWIAFAVKKKAVIMSSTVSHSIGNVALLISAIVAYIIEPSFAFVSLLFTVFFIPSTVLSWLAYVRFKKA